MTDTKEKKKRAYFKEGGKAIYLGLLLAGAGLVSVAAGTAQAVGNMMQKLRPGDMIKKAEDRAEKVKTVEAVPCDEEQQ